MSGIPVGHAWPQNKFNGPNAIPGYAQSTTQSKIITDRMLNLDVYPLTSYTFGTKDAIYDAATDVDVDSRGQPINLDKRFKVLKKEYQQKGMRRTVEAVIVVHEHNLPHLLLLQQGTSYFKLPGGTLLDNESEHQGIRRHLKRVLGKSINARQTGTLDAAHRGIEEDDWVIKDTCGQWYRPKFDKFQYCYKPAHLTKPKEHIKLFLIQLPEKCLFAVPRNYKLVAAPMHEFYENSKTYGPSISALPHMLSRYNMQLK